MSGIGYVSGRLTICAKSTVLSDLFGLVAPAVLRHVLVSGATRLVVPLEAAVLTQDTDVATSASPPKLQVL